MGDDVESHLVTIELEDGATIGEAVALACEASSLGTNAVWVAEVDGRTVAVVTGLLTHRRHTNYPGQPFEGERIYFRYFPFATNKDGHDVLPRVGDRLTRE
ncbi:hypothetical protein [Glycomyces buryatensis]|uniref:Uncharacterized protein n=1 Tax=Glycomyces buryatensis TaxID=2570927 RepID=A0A4V4HSE6_9ACTN|nr:hypothetical protein [Glycomyces buryatensis]THV41436.1 hypothetical protein FAB82_11600 [Glycomyces buryatensis]